MLVLSTCMHFLRCVDEGEDFHCICEKGYKGLLCEVDIDECANHPCFNGGACIDKHAHYECRCPEYAAGSNCESLDTNPGTKPVLSVFVDRRTNAPKRNSVLKFLIVQSKALVMLACGMLYCSMVYGLLYLVRSVVFYGEMYDVLYRYGIIKDDIYAACW